MYETYLRNVMSACIVLSVCNVMYVCNGMNVVCDLVNECMECGVCA